MQNHLQQSNVLASRYLRHYLNNFSIIFESFQLHRFHRVTANKTREADRVTANETCKGNRNRVTTNKTLKKKKIRSTV